MSSTHFSVEKKGSKLSSSERIVAFLLGIPVLGFLLTFIYTFFSYIPVLKHVLPLLGGLMKILEGVSWVCWLIFFLFLLAGVLTVFVLGLQGPALATMIVVTIFCASIALFPSWKAISFLLDFCCHVVCGCIVGSIIAIGPWYMNFGFLPWTIGFASLIVLWAYASGFADDFKFFQE